MKVETTDYAKIKEIFSAALELDPASREEFLSRNCKDVGIRTEVESLLQAQHEAGSFLEDQSVVSVIQNSYQKGLSQKLIGQLLGKYRIIREIGHGGMGVVFLAEREDFQQQVAIKIIKRGMDTDSILNRFFRERQILASLNHPYIAKLLDGGTTDDGIPFFVMEYVEGVPINECCKDLKEKDILELFRKVCSAVSFAHQKLIVHRDLKPTNILINTEGEPKLLDFGIAKLLDETDPNETQPHQRVLTPQYASPEQIAGTFVGTASDVYSLGKILRELLDYPPGEATRGNHSEKADTPKHPNKTKRLSLDLQNILSGAVHENVERRYLSVERFSTDIRRYLLDLPVSARKDSLSYRTQKFVQRNRTKVALAVLLLMSLIGGLTATVFKANEARRERELAEARFENLRKLSGSFVTEIHAAIRDLPGSLAARELLIKRATEQVDALAAESGGNRELQDELATAYFNLASLPDISVIEKDRVLRKEIGIYNNLLQLAPANPRYLEQLSLAYIELADTAKVRGSVADGFSHANMAVEVLNRADAAPSGDPSQLRAKREAYANLATFYTLKGDADRSLQTGRLALEMSEKLQNGNDPAGDAYKLIARSHLQIGVALISTGDYANAISELEQSLNVHTNEKRENPNDTSVDYYLWLLNFHLARANELQGKKSDALNNVRKALSIMESLMATSPKDTGYHRNLALTCIQLGQMLVRQNDTLNAVPYFRRGLQLSLEVLNNDPDYFESKIDLARSRSNLGNALINTGKRDEGLASLWESVKIYEETCPADKENAMLQRAYAIATGWLGSALQKSNRQQATEMLQRSKTIWTELKADGKLSAADVPLAVEAEKQIGNSPH